MGLSDFRGVKTTVGTVAIVDTVGELIKYGRFCNGINGSNGSNGQRYPPILESVLPGDHIVNRFSI